jgi:hypothetical protein
MTRETIDYGGLASNKRGAGDDTARILTHESNFNA